MQVIAAASRLDCGQYPRLPTSHAGGNPFQGDAMLVVAALGRSALQRPAPSTLEERIRVLARGLAPLARHHQLVVTHFAPTTVAAGGLAPDLRAAQAAGLVGHLLARELRNLLPRTPVCSTLAQTVVHREPATANPETPPCRIVELPILRQLVEQEGFVLCVGCVPVEMDATALLGGTTLALEADQAAASLAIELGADILLLLTDVEAVHDRWPARKTHHERIAAERPIPAGLDAATIGAKVEAACRFARTPGTFAVIGRADQAQALVAGAAGTCVRL
jgi:carbamate kinase